MSIYKNIAYLFNLYHNYSESDHRYCPICEQSLRIKEYRNHIGGCYNFNKNPTCLTVAEEGEFMKFYNFKKKLKRQFVVVADFECSLIKSGEQSILQKHEPNSAAVYFVNIFKSSHKSDLVACRKRLCVKAYNCS